MPPHLGDPEKMESLPTSVQAHARTTKCLRGRTAESHRNFWRSFSRRIMQIKPQRRKKNPHTNVRGRPSKTFPDAAKWSLLSAHEEALTSCQLLCISLKNHCIKLWPSCFSRGGQSIQKILKSLPCFFSSSKTLGM